MAVPTLADLKQHLNTTADVNDAELQLMLDAAVEVAARIVGPLAPAPVTESHYGVSARTLVLHRAPAVKLTAISSGVGPSPTALTVADFVLDGPTGIVRPVNGGFFLGDYTVTYSAGHETLPAAIQLGTLVIAAHLWETQRGFSPSPLREDDTVLPTGLGYAIPNRALELLQPYLMPSLA